ncbi:hypothetical protein FRX31_017305 [Thalictrum thalictroides]|uniref:Uncharacterized protein n=1 Tax=Thalictrum thalictroides TaxID=46969 RepID=A0A7J6W6R4_THATH|nr:hypothetical protein FRX31_017305 [Thalictrum thalictroides]
MLAIDILILLGSYQRKYIKLKKAAHKTSNENLLGNVNMQALEAKSELGNKQQKLHFDSLSSSYVVEV